MIKIIPLLLLIALVGVVPFITAFSGSFFHDIFGERTFAGIDNYKYLIEDTGFRYSLYISILWAVLHTILTLAIGTLFAVRLTQRKSGLFFGILLIPWGIPVYIAVPLWRVLIHGNGGESILTALFGIQINLITDPAAGFISALIVSLWMSVPLTTYVLFGAMKKTPVNSIEAAKIDGAGRSDIALFIYLPLIRNSLLVMGVLNFAKAFKEFTVVFLLTGGGPPLVSGITERHVIGATTTLGVFLYNLFHKTDDIGITYTYSVVTAVFVLVPVVLYLIVKTGKGRFKKTDGQRMKMGVRSLFKPFWNISSRITVLFMVISAVILLYLLLWISFSAVSSSYINSFFPEFLTGSNFSKIILEENIIKYFINTFLVAAATGLIIPIITFPAASFLAMQKRSFTVVFLLVIQIIGIAGGMHSLVPLYSLFRKAGLINSYIPLILIYLNHGVPFALFTMTAYLYSVPQGLKDQAKIEGIGPIVYLVKILFPISLPVIVTAVMAAFIGAWNGFLAPLLFLNDDSKYTISVKLYSFVGSVASGNPRWNLFAAVSVVNCIIIGALFIKFKKPMQRTALSDFEE